MRFDRLVIRDLRNLAHVDFVPHPRFNVVSGANGHGKTNLLEAVNLLATLRPFRSLRTKDLVRRGQERAVVEGGFEQAGARRQVRVTLAGQQRRVELNDKPVRKLADFFGAVNTVVFSPEDIAVLRGAPAERRLLLDRMIFNAWPAHALDTERYEHALRNRNALLRAEALDPAMLAIWDRQLVDAGVTVRERRLAFLERIRPLFRETFAEIFDARLDVDLRLACSVTGETAASTSDGATWAEGFERALRQARSRDVAIGHTTIGPHRDDVEALLQGEPIRAHGSQGQHRAFVLALKITEIRLLRHLLDHWPVLLLDDVSSELDPARNAMLFAFLSGFDGQVFLTTTDRAFIRLDGPAAYWMMRDGELTGDAST